MVNERNVVVTADATDPATQQAAAVLAARLGLNLAPAANATTPDDLLWLALGEDHLELRDASMRPGKGVFIDFSTLHPTAARRRGGFSRQQPLAKAIGKHSQRVLDATAGLGHDAALLACMGYDVLAVERSPIVFALLEDGLRRAMVNPELAAALGGRLSIVNADARRALRRESPHVDAVYIDPMFPPKRKASALAKKEIRLIRHVVGDDEDAGELLEVARQQCQRVIVKRPGYAAPLAEKPTMSFPGKLVRYDVYVK